MQVSKRFYIGAPIALFVAMFALLLTSPSYDVAEAGPRLAIPLLVHIAIQLRLVYIAWASIQDSATRLSPRLAAGLLLVPGIQSVLGIPGCLGILQELQLLHPEAETGSSAPCPLDLFALLHNVLLPRNH
jgi:hypothetical protein